MIDRRHEKLALDALQDLVRYLRGVREERKAILAITNGWLLYRPDDRLCARWPATACPPVRPSAIDPRSGRLTTREPAYGAPTRADATSIGCVWRSSTTTTQFREMLDEANRANASFYPIDPRGLAVFDTPLVRQDVPGPAPPITPLPVDRGDALRRGSIRCARWPMPPTASRSSNSNDLAGGLRRVVADLSSYYLLGYYSTGKLDGRFHSITVRVKRPGREGARAPRLSGLDAGGGCCGGSRRCLRRRRRTCRAETDINTAAAEAGARAIEAAIGPLAGYAREVPLRLQVAAGWKPGDTASAAMWVVGELGGVATLGDAWNNGFDVTITLTTTADATVGSGSVSVGERRPHVPRRRDAVTAAGPWRLRAARWRARRSCVDPVARDRRASRFRQRRIQPARSSFGAVRGTGRCRPPICASAGTSRFASKSRPRDRTPSRRGCSIARGSRSRCR